MVVAEYTPQHRFYGSVHGKLCIGLEQCGQLDAAKTAGQVAIEHTPQDLFSVHSMAHVWDTLSLPDKVVSLLLRHVVQ